MKNLTIHRPGDVPLPGARALPDAPAAVCAHPAAPAAHYSGPAIDGVLEHALARWPLLWEIDQSLADMRQKPVDPNVVCEMSL